MSTTLLTPTSFCLLVWRRSETGDRFEKGERQRIFITVGEHSVLPFFFASAQCRIPYCYTYRLLYAGATYPCRATRLLGGHGRHLRVLLDNG